MVTSSDSRAWRDLLRPVLQAQSLADAQVATSDLIDAVLPGGAVLHNDAAALVRQVRATPDLADNPYRGYVVSVLAAMAAWAHVWRHQVEDGNTSDAAISGARAEREAADELSRTGKHLAPLLDDQDPEVRGLMYLLLGGADERALETAELLERRAVREADELARACAYQGIVKTAARTSASDAAQIGSWLASALKTESDVVGRRVRAELESSARALAEQQRIQAAVGMSAANLPSGPVPMWSAEGV